MRRILVKVVAAVALVAGISVGASAPASAKPVSGTGSVSQHGGTVRPAADWWT